MERIRKYTPLWGEWEAKRIIGEGNFGVVYEVEKYITGNSIHSAVKLISMKNSEILQGIKGNETLSPDKLEELKLERAKRSVREAALMDKLKGRANIVTIYDYGIYPGEKTTDVIIRMELLDNLNQYLSKTKVEESLVIKLGIDICKALEGCEEEKIIHRDIKPANIFVGRGGDFKLGDFGLSRQVSKSASLSLRKSKGTPLYMPPEAFGWGQQVDLTSDIYSLGIVMYQLLDEGNIPFCGDIGDFEEVDKAIGKRVDGNEQISAPKNCGKELWSILQKACAHEKKARYQNATEMRRDLERLRDQSDLERKMKDENLSSSFRFSFSVKSILKKAQDAWDENRFSEAFQLFEKAAELGNAEGQCALGYCYYIGRGTEADERKALFWFDQAAVQGHSDAKNTAEKIRKQIKQRKSNITYHVGDTFVLGAYVQDNDSIYEKKPIEWIVLKKEEEKMLVISKMILDCIPYHEKEEEITWEISDIHRWLNEYFYETAFHIEERKKIKDTVVGEEKTTNNDSKSENNKTDHIFLLSVDEAETLFSSDQERRCSPTEYAISQEAITGKISGNCRWWLRSLGSNDTSRASFVSMYGHVYRSGSNVNINGNGVRPAMWIDLGV